MVNLLAFSKVEKKNIHQKYLLLKEIEPIESAYSTTETRNTTEIIQKQYPDWFNGVGNLKGVSVKLDIDTTVPPVANKHRRIPIHLRPVDSKELDRLEEHGIIEKADGPTPWISLVVLSPRAHDPNSVRMCVDMRGANMAIKRERHITPTVDEIIATLNGSKVFSKLDLKDGFHQITLDKESRYITHVFNT